jgi:hypothetical protein
MPYDYPGGALQGKCNSEMMPIQRSASLLENTKQQLEKAKIEVLRLEELVSLLEANPETQRIMELLANRF